MKRKFTVLALMTSLVFILLSCSKEKNLLNNYQTETSGIFSQKITDAGLIQEIQSKVGELKSGVKVNFDTENIYRVGLSENSPKVLMVYQQGFDRINRSNLGLSIAPDENGYWGTPVIVKTERISDHLRRITYFNESFTLLISIELDSKLKKMKTLYKKPVLKTTGQNMSDCIESTYINQGWGSIWSHVQTAFTPETAIAISATCMGSDH